MIIYGIIRKVSVLLLISYKEQSFLSIKIDFMKLEF